MLIITTIIMISVSSHEEDSLSGSQMNFAMADMRVSTATDSQPRGMYAILHLALSLSLSLSPPLPLSSMVGIMLRMTRSRDRKWGNFAD